MPKPGFEITLAVSGVKEEHVRWTLNALNALSRIFVLDGTDVGIGLSVERDRDGVERLAEYLDVES